MRAYLFSILVVLCSMFPLHGAPPQVSQVFVNQDSIGFNITVTGQDTLRIWTGTVTFTLFDPDSDRCRITLETNKPNASITSYGGDTLIPNGLNNTVSFTITAYEPLGYDVQLKVIADDSLPYKAAVSGVTVLSDGFPAEYSRVMLPPNNFNPVLDSIPPKSIDTTGEDGVYIFKGVSAGVYTVYGLGFINFARTFAPHIQVIGPETVTVNTAILKIPGKIKLGSNLLPAYTPDAYVYLPGTLNYEMIDSIAYVNNQILIDSIPEGTVPSIHYSVVGSDTSAAIAGNIVVISGDTTVVQ
jgi:hypothetical protein